MVHRINLPSGCRLHPISQLRQTLGRSDRPQPLPEFLTEDCERAVAIGAKRSLRRQRHVKLRTIANSMEGPTGLGSKWEPAGALDEWFPTFHLADKMNSLAGSNRTTPLLGYMRRVRKANPSILNEPASEQKGPAEGAPTVGRPSGVRLGD